MSRKNNSILWKYFEINDKETKKATCKLCFEMYSYATTITNLKTHLLIKHNDSIPETLSSVLIRTPRNLQSKSKKTNPLWNYFTQVSNKPFYAKCNVCKVKLSYKSTTANLRIHLQHKHPEEHEMYKNLPPPDHLKTIEDDSSDSNQYDDTASEEKRNDIWNYFEEENKKARCVECHDIISDISYDSLKAHLFAQHPKLLLDLVQEQDALEDSHLVLKSATDDEDDSNTFTEVVYLEQDLAEDTLQKKSKNINVFNPKRATKRNRNNSSSDHPIIKQIKDEEIPKADADTELDTFLKYIRCLLKKLSPDGFSKVQIDILKTIMDAVTADKITVTNNSSVPNIHIPHSSMGNIIKIGELGSQNLNNFTLKLIETVPSVTVSDDVKQN